MARYVSKPPRPTSFDDDWYEPPLTPDLTVVESDPVPTGLLDADGYEIWRMKDPIGFIWHD